MCQIAIVAKTENRARQIVTALGPNRPCQVLSISDVEYKSARHDGSPPDLLIIDLESTHGLPSRFFERCSRINPEATIVVIAPAENSLPIEALVQLGVDEVIIRADDEKPMSGMIERLLQKIATHDRLLALREKLRKEMGQSQIVAKSKPMQAIMKLLPQLANAMSTVLITGETGTGKELIARAIHYLGPRAGQPFITVDCGTLPEHLVENELFGHARGAYTDAGPSTKGLIQEADGGTLFLDEVESLPLVVQSRFLRFLQERQYKPLGQSKYISVNVRVLAATNIDLAKAVEKKLFREDLYFRLNVVPLFIPPLRERKVDIPALAYYFFQQYAHHLTAPREITNEMLQNWLAYDWPGNVRELENKVQEWLTISSTDFRQETTFSLAAAKPIQTLGDARKEALAQFERTYLHDLLTHVKGNLSAAARLAGTDRKNLRCLLKRYGLERQRFC